MSWVAAAIATSAGLSYLGGQKQAEAAKGAARTQAGAAREQLEFQREMFERLQAQQGPYRQTGYAALGRLSDLLGLGPVQDPYAIARYEQAQQQQMDLDQFKPQFDQARREAILRIGPTGKRGAVTSAADIAALGESAREVRRGGGFGRLAGQVAGQMGVTPEGDRRIIVGQRDYRAAKEEQEQLDRLAASQKAIREYQAAQMGLPPGTELMAGGGVRQTGLQDKMFRGDKRAMMEAAAAGQPMAGGGMQAYAPAARAPGQLGTGDLARMFTAADLETHLAPNYEFMKQQGLGAISQSANVGGGGSNVQRGAIKFAQDYARNAYQDALNNFRLQQGDIFNRLSNISGTGQTAQQSAAQTAAQFGGNISQLGIGAAQAQAAGQVGAANAYAGALGNVGGTLGTYGLLRGMGAFGQPGSTGQATGFYTNPSPVGQTAGTSLFTSPTGGYVGDVNVPNIGVA